MKEIKEQVSNKKQAEKPIKQKSTTFPSFIYYTFSHSEALKKYVNEIKKQIKQFLEQQNFQSTFKLGDIGQWVQEEQKQNLHISISKVFRVYPSQKQLLISTIKKEINQLSGGSAMVPVTFQGIRIINDRFIVLIVEKGICYDRINKVTETINKGLAKWNFQPYFQNPIFHITLFKLNKQKIIKQQTETPQLAQQKYKSSIEYLTDRFEQMRFKSLCFNCKQICMKIGNRVHKIT